MITPSCPAPCPSAVVWWVEFIRTMAPSRRSTRWQDHLNSTGVDFESLPTSDNRDCCESRSELCGHKPVLWGGKV